MSMIISGERVGSFIVLKDDDGMRHAVRLGAVLAMSDGIDGLGTTIIQLPGNRTVLVHASLDEVLTWFIP